MYHVLTCLNLPGQNHFFPSFFSGSLFPSFKILSENDDDDHDDDDHDDDDHDDDDDDDDPHHPHSFLRCFKLKNVRIKAPEQPYDGKVSELTVAEFPEKFGEGPREENRSSKKTLILYMINDSWLQHR